MESRHARSGEDRVCASCLDGAHGNCVVDQKVLGGPLCTCECPKRCSEHHPSPRIPQSCSLTLGHGGPHYGGIEWVRAEDCRPWTNCLCGYMGSSPHACDLTGADLTVIARMGDREVTIRPTYRKQYASDPVFDVECQIMQAIRGLEGPSHAH